jgi:predicted DNA-binding transcriptional regulator AlpA
LPLARHVTMCNGDGMPNDDDLLTAPQVGKLFNRSARTVHRLVEAGKLPVAQKLPGPAGAYLFRRSDVIRALNLEPADDEAVSA